VPLADLLASWWHVLLANEICARAPVSANPQAAIILISRVTL